VLLECGWWSYVQKDWSCFDRHASRKNGSGRRTGGHQGCWCVPSLLGQKELEEEYRGGKRKNLRLVELSCSKQRKRGVDLCRRRGGEKRKRKKERGLKGTTPVEERSHLGNSGG